MMARVWCDYAGMVCCNSVPFCGLCHIYIAYQNKQKEFASNSGNFTRKEK